MNIPSELTFFKFPPITGDDVEDIFLCLLKIVAKIIFLVCERINEKCKQLYRMGKLLSLGLVSNLVLSLRDNQSILLD